MMAVRARHRHRLMGGRIRSSGHNPDAKRIGYQDQTDTENSSNPHTIAMTHGTAAGKISEDTRHQQSVKCLVGLNPAADR